MCVSNIKSSVTWWKKNIIVWENFWAYSAKLLKSDLPRKNVQNPHTRHSTPWPESVYFCPISVLKHALDFVGVVFKSQLSSIILNENWIEKVSRAQCVVENEQKHSCKEHETASEVHIRTLDFYSPWKSSMSWKKEGDECPLCYHGALKRLQLLCQKLYFLQHSRQIGWVIKTLSARNWI